MNKLNLITAYSLSQWITKSGNPKGDFQNFSGIVSNDGQGRLIVKNDHLKRGWGGALFPVKSMIVPVSPEKSEGTILKINVLAVESPDETPVKFSLVLQWPDLATKDFRFDWYARIPVSPHRRDSNKSGLYEINLSHILWNFLLPAGEYYYVQVLAVGPKGTKVTIDQLELLNSLSSQENVKSSAAWPPSAKHEVVISDNPEYLLKAHSLLNNITFWDKGVIIKDRLHMLSPSLINLLKKAGYLKRKPGKY